MSEPTKPIFLTRFESELLLDSVKVSNPMTRNLALKAAGLCLEWSADEASDQAAALAKGGKTAERPAWMREVSE